MSKPAAPLKGRAARLARLMPSTGPSTAARTPFVLLVVLLLGGGLITLLLLNSALNEGSFRLSELKRDTTELTDEQQALQRDVDSRSQPDALERRARELGMVPGGSPAFLDPDGTVRGNPTEATAPPPSPSPSPSPTPGPRASAGAAPDPDATGASGSASPSGSAAEPGSATESDSATAPAAESTPPPTSPGR
ncbi:FtsB family cell division protein [Streptomyces anulatus]|uniref:FtsB family cell division protein n=1 Tax=Streptomyces anulatus TaxID=1892 RepID=UPI00225AD4F5|nr:septum formation initiator [Streptomyces anulatus]MCX4504733.1 septum formation initiator family protein [Streptomyces anulatus]